MVVVTGPSFTTLHPFFTPSTTLAVTPRPAHILGAREATTRRLQSRSLSRSLTHSPQNIVGEGKA